jgi:hypothetical protein
MASVLIEKRANDLKELISDPERLIAKLEVIEKKIWTLKLRVNAGTHVRPNRKISGKIDSFYLNK